MKDDNLLKIQSNRRIEALSDKFKDKPYSQNWSVVRIIIALLGFAVQIVTSLFALALPSYAFYVLFGSWIAGFAVGAVLLVLFESIKHFATNKAALEYFKNGRIDFGLTAFVLLLLSCSVASSYFGTPILITEFSPKPSKPIESDIVKPFDSTAAAVTAYWNSQKSDLDAKAAAVFSANNWRGTLTRDARPTQLALQKQAAAATDSLNAALARIEVQKQAAIASAMSDYDKASKTSSVNVQNVGFWLSIVTLIFELVFVACFCWLQYYDFRHAVELGLIKAEIARQEPKRVTLGTDIVTAKESTEPQQRPASNIGFNNEGRILYEGDKKKILCVKSSGELKAYTKSELSTLIGDALRKNKPERAKYWQTMKEKLQ